MVLILLTIESIWSVKDQNLLKQEERLTSMPKTAWVLGDNAEEWSPKELA